MPSSQHISCSSSMTPSTTATSSTAAYTPSGRPSTHAMCVLTVALFWHMTSQGVFLRSHSMSVDLTLFPSDALHSFGLRQPTVVLSALIAYFARFDAFPLERLSYRAPSPRSSELVFRLVAICAFWEAFLKTNWLS
jgi:hypothetical protein